MMAVTPLDLLAAAALLALTTGLGAATWRAFDLLARLIPPRPHWITRGVLLVALAVVYVGMVILDIPGVLTALVQPGGQATAGSVAKTLVLSAWMWTMTTVLLMLARGRLGEQPIWRRP